MFPRDLVHGIFKQGAAWFSISKSVSRHVRGRTRCRGERWEANPRSPPGTGAGRRPYSADSAGRSALAGCCTCRAATSVHFIATQDPFIADPPKYVSSCVSVVHVSFFFVSGHVYSYPSHSLPLLVRLPAKAAAVRHMRRRSFARRVAAETKRPKVLV